MAVLQKDVAQKRNASETSEASKHSNTNNDLNKGIVVDLTAKGLWAGDAVTIDPTEDAWARSAPPPRGDYDLKLFMAKEFAKLITADNDENVKWYELNLECRIVNSAEGEFDNLVVFPKVSTYLGRGKNTTTCMGLIQKLGYKIPERPLNHVEQAQLLHMAIKKEPLAKVLLDWSGWSQKNNRVVFKSMLDWPLNDDSTYQHEVDIVANDGTTETIKASVKVRHWYGKNEPSLLVEAKEKNVTSGKVLTPSSTTGQAGAGKPQAATGKAQGALAGATGPQIVPEPPQAQVQGQEQKVTTQTSDDDLILEDE